jgi:hypothetical protein
MGNDDNKQHPQQQKQDRKAQGAAWDDMQTPKERTKQQPEVGEESRFSRDESESRQSPNRDDEGFGIGDNYTPSGNKPTYADDVE